jgi:hypothetical protein
MASRWRNKQSKPDQPSRIGPENARFGIGNAICLVIRNGEAHRDSAGMVIRGVGTHNQ